MELHTHQGLNGRLGRVLVVEDQPDVRKPIMLSLTKAGYEVVEAEDGQQAIHLLNAGDNPLMVDTILCDLRMPRINGTEAIAYFRREYPSVPVVVLTGYPDVGLAVSLMKQGVLDYLVKPISREELLTVIRKAVSQHVILNDSFTV